MDRLRRLGHVVEGMDHAGDGLALLVTLAGHHQDVAVACSMATAGADRRAAVADLLGASARVPPRTSARIAAGSSDGDCRR
jgi:hypothetical protein